MNDRAVASIYSTTPAQQGFLLGTLTGNDAVFVEQTVFPLIGPLDRDRLNRACAELVTDHEILRTGFAWQLGGEPQQVVLATGTLVPEYVDGRGLAHDVQQAAVQQLLARHRDAPFDLARPPLLRLAVHRLDDERHQLLWTHHHVALDGWSHLALVRELLARYAGAPGQRSSFGQYARWLASIDQLPEQQHWTKHLDGYRSLDRLATGGQPGFGCHESVFDENSYRALLTVLTGRDLTVASAIVGCWGLVAGRFRGRADIAVGVTVSGRSAPFPGLTEVAGPVATTVPVRLPTARGCSASTWLSEVRGLLLAAEQHSGCSNADLHTWLGIEPGTTLYDTVVAVATYPRTTPDDLIGELRLAPVEVASFGGRTRHPLTLVVDLFEGLRLRLVNDRRQVSDPDADAALNAMRSLLQALTDRDEVFVDDLEAEIRSLSPLPLQVPAADRPPSAPPGADPSLAHVIATVFAEVLGRPAGLGTDFLTAGGHSLLALRLLHRLRTTLQVDLTLRDLLDAGTPAAFAARTRQILAGGMDASPSLPALRPAGNEPRAPFPLTGIQQAYWTGRSDEFDLGGVDSHLYTEVDIVDLDSAKLATVWRALIERHPMLRTVMTADGRQQVHDAVPPYQIVVTDLQDLSDARRQLALEDLRRRLSHPRRDTTRWPLFTIEVALLPDGVTRLFLSFDLLIGDALSWQILYREARALYENPSTALPTLDLTFADYVGYLASLTGTDRYRRDRDYWQAKLPNLPSPPELPLTATGAAVVQPRFCRHQLKLARPVAEALRRVAAAHGCTLSTLLLAVFNETLRRFSGMNHFLVNVTVYNRPPAHHQINMIVGDFTSTVLAEVDLRAATFGERVRHLQRTLWSDLDHILYGGVDVLRDLRELHPDRHTIAPVVFTSTLDLNPDGPEPGTPFPGTVGFGIGQTPQVLLDYQTYEVGTELVVNLDAVDGAFPDGLVQGMLDHHIAALQLLATDALAAHRPHLDVIEAAPALPAPIGEAHLLHEPFVDQATRHPDRIALVYDKARITFGDLHQQADALAERIAATDPAGDLVALLCRPGPGQIAAALATLLAGYAFVPLDVSWPRARVTELLATTGAGLVLTDAPTGIPLISTAQVLAIDPNASGPQTQQKARQRHQPSDVAYVIFTSGSTGHPKGVTISHQGALNTVLDVNQRYAVTAADTVLAVSALTFDLAIYDLFGLLAAGGTVVIPTVEQRRDPEAWAHLIREEQVTVWNSVPVLMDLLTDSLASDNTALNPLRLCLLSGDWVPVQLPGKIRKLAPECHVVSLGGATEGSIWSVLYDVGDVETQWTSIPYGRAMTGQTVTVLDSELRPCPAWVPGQIHIGGHGTAVGYWNAPDLTASSFVFDGRTGTRLYRTGDWGRTRPDGVIEFLGRRDDQVKVRGYRVELREVEAALRGVAGVVHAAVVAVGERGDQRLAAFVVTDLTADDVRHDLARALPAHMLPGSVTILDQMPVSATSKLDRGALALLATNQPVPTASPDASPGPALKVRDGVPGADDIRRELATVLTSPPGLDEDLIALGLTSVDIIRVANVAERACGRRPRLRDFSRNPTVRFLLQHLTGADLDGSDPEGEAQPQASRGQDLPTPWDVPELTSPEQRRRFRAERPAYPPAPATRTLPRTEPLPARARTAQRFTEDAVTAEQLAGLLTTLSRTGDPGRFQYSSAGGLYVVQVHVHVRPGRVGQVPAGMYTYHPDAADLVAYVTDVDLDDSVHLGPTNRPLARTAAFTVFLTTDPADSAPIYGPDAEPLALLNAGYLGQLLYGHAGSHGLGLCPVHGIDFDAVRWMVPGGDRAVLLHTLVGGIPASSCGSSE